jgi:hypothetical protein
MAVLVSLVLFCVCHGRTAGEAIGTRQFELYSTELRGATMQYTGGAQSHSSSSDGGGGATHLTYLCVCCHVLMTTDHLPSQARDNFKRKQKKCFVCRRLDGTGSARKRVCLRQFILNSIILPRQARDKHRENSKQDAFLQGVLLRH